MIRFTTRTRRPSWMPYSHTTLAAPILMAMPAPYLQPFELIAVVGCGLIAWLLIAPPLARPARIALSLSSLLCLCVAAASFVAPQFVPLAMRTVDDKAVVEAALHEPVVRAEDPEFVGSKACRACHPGAFSTWHDSYHRTMTQKPSPATVVGRFDGVMMQIGGRSIRMSRVGDDFFAEFPAAEGAPGAGKLVRRRIVLTTGAHHQQAYWFATGAGRELALAPVVWVRASQAWVPFDDIFVRPPATATDEPTEVKSTGQWNRTCIRCHTTQPRERFGDSDVAEHGITCEACHGPGRTHVARWRSPLLRYAAHVRRALTPSTGLPKSADDHIVQPKKLGHKRGSEICGQCHAPLAGDPERFDSEQEHGSSYRAGDELAKHASLVRGDSGAGRDKRPQHAPANEQPVGGHRLLSGLFFRDGGLRVSGREFAALSRSACYQRGKLGCATCHKMHGPREAADDQLAPGMRGDTACTGCHTKLASSAAAAAHSGHPHESSGARCMNCHMPNTAWGLLKATRDHEIRSPNIAGDRAAGRPNACNLCHLDKTETWAETHFNTIFGGPRQLDVAQAAAVAKGATPRRADGRPQVAASIDWLLTGEPGIRALMTWHFAWKPALKASGQDWQAPLLAIALNDPYAAIRRRAAESMRALGVGPPADFEASAPPHLRRPAVQRALARWLEGGDATRARPTLLQDDRGRLNVQAMRALMRHADRRDVALEE